MAIEVTVQVAGFVTACVVSDTPYNPDTAEDLLRRCRENALKLFLELPDDTEAPVDDQG